MQRIFPNNPFFKPQAPLNLLARQTILLKSQTQTPVEIAKEFNLSIKRVEAIIRLQSVPCSVDTQPLSKNMDELLNASSLGQFKEELRPMTINPIKPFMQFIDEEASFTPAVSLLTRMLLNYSSVNHSKT
jgi:hypothetical protein